MKCDLSRSSFCGVMKQGFPLYSFEISNSESQKRHLPWYFDRRNQQFHNLELQYFCSNPYKMSCSNHHNRPLCHMFLSTDLLLLALNGRILKILIGKYLDESNKEMNKLSFQIVLELTWFIGARNSCSHQSWTRNHPINTIVEFPSTSSCVVIEEPPICICVYSLLFIDCIVSIGKHSFICARNKNRIQYTFTLCLNF